MAEEEDRVFARILYSGIHRGDLFGYAATHGRIKWDGVAIFRFRDSKIAELWVLWDVNDVMKQLARYVMD
jgi:predicted ester cyclase